MRKGLLVLIVLLSICLSGCRISAMSMEESLPMEESGAENSADNMLEETAKNIQKSGISTPSILQVQTDTELGSGVLWDKLEKEWIVVTAAHVVEGLQEADIYLVQEDKILPARVHEVKGLDLAFLSVSTVSLETQIEDAYIPAGKDNGTEKEDTIIYTMGYNPYGELCEFSGQILDDWIYVEDFNNYMMICDCRAIPGMSGGAVFSDDDKLVGLICGENEQGILAVLPIGVIRNEYELYKKN